MKDKHSWTRRQYEIAYRFIRRGYNFDWLVENRSDFEQVLKAADYSYQAYGYEPNGWVSELRRKRFHAIKVRFLTREELPF